MDNGVPLTPSLRCDGEPLTTPLQSSQLTPPDAMEYLVGEGVPVDVVDTSGITPLHCSIANDNAQSCQILLEKGANVNPVMRTKDVSYHGDRLE